MLGTSVARAFTAPRLQLAAKAGLAAGVAFAIAPLMPAPAAHYPYYAPLGALVAMYENVSGSMRQGLQSLVGLALGIPTGVYAGQFQCPRRCRGRFHGVGVLLGGLPRIGSGSDWIPTAALLSHSVWADRTLTIFPLVT